MKSPSESSAATSPAADAPRKLNPIGQRFGRLLVIREGPPRFYKRIPHRRFWCLCECGTGTLIPLAALRSGNSSSCGCVRVAQFAARATTHGGHGSGTHTSWRGMKERCLNPRHPKYPQYGGRGIKVCARWFSFENFRSDMGDRPAGLTLDRINNAGDYEPSNCRWATPREQQTNRRVNHTITIDGQTRCLTEWARLNGLSLSCVRGRLRRGWAERDAVMPIPSPAAKSFSAPQPPQAVPGT